MVEPPTSGQRNPDRRFRVIALVCAVAAVAAAIGIEFVVLRPSQDTEVSHLTAGCRSPAPQLSVLLIGNSYTAANDLAGLLGDVLCKSRIATNVRIESMTRGGATLSSWVDDGVGDQMAGHDVVVLQEQSQTPGLYGVSSVYQSSWDAVNRLAADARATHARVVLFETWGRAAGDPANPVIYPNFEAMQQRITAGYARYLASLSSGWAPRAEVAPVGHAWECVHERHPELFSSLYASDGGHPSPVGSYLAALVLARTITDRPLPASLWQPSEVAPTVARELSAAAGRASLGC